LNSNSLFSLILKYESMDVTGCRMERVWWKCWL
jgi:hypothetical protein